jgi:hypothetical protein
MSRAMGIAAVVLLVAIGVAAISLETSPLIDGAKYRRYAVVHGWPAIVSGLAFLAIASAVFFGMCLPHHMRRSAIRRRGINYSLAVFLWLVVLAGVGAFLHGGARAV